MFKHILLPLDGSALAEKVLPHAVALAEAFGSRLSLLRVVYRKKNANQHGVVNPMEWQMRKSEAEAYLKVVRKQLAAIDIESEIRVLEGNPAQQIIEYTHREEVELIIMSSHGSSGISEWNINSVVQKVLLRAFIPVMIIRSYQEGYDGLKGLNYERLLLPLDGSKRAECVLPLAKSISSAHNSTVFLTHIVEEPKLPRQTPLSDEDKKLVSRLSQINIDESEKYFKNLITQFENQQVEMIIESSRKPTIALHNIVDREKINLVLLSAHGYSGENRWPYGKIALNFIVYGTTPLLILQDLSQDEVAKTLAEKYAEQSKGH
jgi:nucleotide-binding universal stress UspA family protein